MTRCISAPSSPSRTSLRLVKALISCEREERNIDVEALTRQIASTGPTFTCCLCCSLLQSCFLCSALLALLR